MRRRDFTAMLAGAVALRPIIADAQQKAMPVIGFLSGAMAAAWAPWTGAFRRGLSESGYDEGRNVAVEYRWADGQYDRLPAMAADLIDRPVLVIVAASTPAALAAKAATATIPIVFSTISDPVQIGLVPSLSRPGGNVTGVTQLNVEMGPKLLEQLHEAVPAAGIMALLVNPTNPNSQTLSRDLQAAARTLGLQLHVLNASTEREIEASFATLVQLRAGGLVIGGDPFLNSSRQQIAALALRHAVPSIYQSRVYPEAGGLMSYGSDGTEVYRHVGVYAGRILTGAKPADLPVQQATRVELVVNLKTARTIGLTVPQSLRARADEIIE